MIRKQIIDTEKILSGNISTRNDVVCILRKQPFRVCFIKSHSPIGIGHTTRLRGALGVPKAKSKVYHISKHKSCRVIG